MGEKNALAKGCFPYAKANSYRATAGRRQATHSKETSRLSKRERSQLGLLVTPSQLARSLDRPPILGEGRAAPKGKDKNEREKGELQNNFGRRSNESGRG